MIIAAGSLDDLGIARAAIPHNADLGLTYYPHDADVRFALLIGPRVACTPTVWCPGREDERLTKPPIPINKLLAALTPN